MAVYLHGHVRPVADLDLVLDREPKQAQRALQSLLAGGFIPTIAAPLSAVSVLRLFDQAQREVDVFLRHCIPFEELWQNSARDSVNGSLIRVISLGDLLKEKRFIGRVQDLQDVEMLLALKGSA
jgi:hypothetical protein